MPITLKDVHDDLQKTKDANHDWHNKVYEMFALIKDNHLAHIQGSVGALEVKHEAVRNDIDWIKRFFWIIATATIGSLVSGVLALIFQIITLYGRPHP